MKLGLPSSGKEMDKLIDPRFGRCQYFIVIDPKTFSFKAKENPFKSTDRGAGIQAAQWMADRRVKTVLSSRVGPNALKVLKAAGITVITGVSGKIGEAVDHYRAGKAVNSSAKPNAVNAPSAASSNIGSRRGLGPGGECICTKCTTSVAHRRGVPCRDEACPKCGARMRRERG